jgi:hypothetical protein
MDLHSALRIIGLGVLMAGCGLAAPRIPSLTRLLTVNGLDFVQGLCFGLALAFATMGVTAIVAAARSRGKGAKG